MEVVGVVFSLSLVPIAALLALYHIRRLQSEERVKAIEKGVSIPFEPVDQRIRAARLRTAGIVLLTLGLGMIVAFSVGAVAQRDREVFTGVGVAAIPIMIGLGLLYDSRLRRREFEPEPPRLPNG